MLQNILFSGKQNGIVAGEIILAIGIARLVSEKAFLDYW